MMLPRLELPPSPRTLALIALAFALPGLASHDLWKTHDAIGLGIVHDMATSGTPLVPRVAGMPWLFDPPLYHWLALGFGLVLQYVMEFHAGARLASGALVLGAFYLIYIAARDWAKPDDDRRTHGAAAMLLTTATDYAKFQLEFLERAWSWRRCETARSASINPRERFKDEIGVDGTDTSAIDET